MNRSLLRPPRRRPAALAHPWVVLVGWIAFFAIVTPTALNYTHSVNYAGSSASLTGTESAQAQALLSTVAPARSTLLVVVDQSRTSPSELQNQTLAFQLAVSETRLPYVNGTQSAYSAYSGYLDTAFGPWVPTTRTLAASTENLTNALYGFPAHFLAQWIAQGASLGSINASFVAANGSRTGYDQAILDWLLANYSAGVPAAQLVQTAVVGSARAYFPAGPGLDLALSATNVTTFSGATPVLVSQLLRGEGVPFPVPETWVSAALVPGDFGTNFVTRYGLVGLPSFLRSQFVSPDGTIAVVRVDFSVPDSFRTSDGTYPAQAATPAIRGLAAEYFGSTALVTGAGAFAYDAAQLTNGSGALFALTFVFLGLAVALTLRSWVAPLLTLALVSLATIVGYLAIEFTGLAVGKVDFTVTYTLTAVTLGVATDYTLFLLYRYREELTQGKPPVLALETATRSSGFAILVSALTVAAGLGSLSFLSGLETWGPVLALTILAVAVLEVTMLPALVRLIGPRLFVRRWLRPASPPERSAFYRAAARSGARPLFVLALAAVVAVPAVVGFLVVPTSYNFAGGVPSGTPSAQGQQAIEGAFGANLLYPTYVIVTAQTTFLEPNGSLSPEGARVLPQVAAALLHFPGVNAVNGPFVSGTNLTPPGNVTADGAATFSLAQGRAVYYVVYSPYDPYSPNAISLVSSLRGNSTYLVGGVTSAVIDQEAQNRVQYPTLEILLAVLIALILGLAFRSLTIPLISLSGVFLSISATTGLLYLISAYVLHTALLWLIPLILFVILMSLGNDYTVFLLSRVREEQRHHGAEEGIRRGIAGSGVVVSALGLILALSLGSLALQPIAFLEEVGIAFVISLILDTFVVRPFYFPAMLTLAARRRGRRGIVGGPADGAGPPGGEVGVP